MKLSRVLSVMLLFAGLSLFILSCGSSGSSSDDGGGDTHCPSAILKTKPIDFHNTSHPSVTVKIFEYDLACPDVRFLNPSDVAWSPGSPGSDFDAHLLLPQGRYSACIDWWDDDESTYLYKIYGDLPDRPLFELNETTDETVPPKIYVSPEYPIDGFGLCPAPVAINGGDGSISGFDVDSSAFSIIVQFIGNDGETTIYNPTPQQIATADIILSGSLNSLGIGWKLEDVAMVAVVRSSVKVYAIVGSPDRFGDRYVIEPPIAYGDYSRRNTERSGAPLPAPKLVAGEYYTITIATLYGESAYIGFSITD